MIAIFRKNLFINSLLLLPYCFLLRIQFLLNPTKYTITESDGWLVQWFFNIPVSALGQNIIACILIFLQGAFINRIIIKNRIAHEATLLPGMFFILFSSFLSGFHGLSPLVLANTFFLFALVELMSTYKKPRAASFIFNTGFFISLAALIYTPYVIFLLFALIGLISLRSFKLVERLQLIIGAIAPYFLMGSWFYFKSRFDEFFSTCFAFNGNNFLNIFNFQNSDYSPLLFSVLIVIVILGYNGFTMKKSIQVQKKIEVLFWALFISFFSIFFIRDLQLLHIQIIIPALAPLFAMVFIRIKNNVGLELLHMLFVIGLFVLHFDILQSLH